MDLHLKDYAEYMNILTKKEYDEIKNWEEMLKPNKEKVLQDMKDLLQQQRDLIERLKNLPDLGEEDASN